jgi:hypothetical protein
MATKRYRRDLKELERRRRKGMWMLACSVAQAEVARTLKITMPRYGLPYDALLAEGRSRNSMKH